jgi:type I restriction enzyme S subunit
VQLGRQRSPQNRSDKYPTKYLRAANITEEGIDISDVLEMDFRPEERTRYDLQAGDLILSEASGSPNQVGKPALCREEHANYCFQNTVIRQRPTTSISEYLLVVYKNYYFNKVFARVAAGVGINHLSAAKFSRLVVPLPPELEQQRIVGEVHRGLALAEAFERTVAMALQRSTRLRQAVLQGAFSRGG